MEARERTWNILVLKDKQFRCARGREWVGRAHGGNFQGRKGLSVRFLSKPTGDRWQINERVKRMGERGRDREGEKTS